MLNIGPQELLLILVIALIVVGPQRLPTLGRSIGRGLREIRKAQDEVKRTIQVTLDEEPGRTVTEDGGGAAVTEAVPPAVTPDPAPSASEPLPPSEVTEISRKLGRSLGELRRAKEEIRKSFRVGVDEPTPRAAPSKTSPTPPTSPDPSAEARTADETPAG